MEVGGRDMSALAPIDIARTLVSGDFNRDQVSSRSNPVRISEPARDRWDSQGQSGIGRELLPEPTFPRVTAGQGI